MIEMQGIAKRDSISLEPIYRSAIAVLTWGFRTGAALLVAGLSVALVRGESIKNEVDPFSDVIPRVVDGRAAGIIDLAILAIMITPLVTVLTVATGFFRAGDRRFGLCSLVVLIILCVSVTLSLLR